jgi:hypothetical protein
MPIVVECADCHKRYRLADSAGGRRAKCSSCGAMMNVPAAAGDTPAAKPQSYAAPPAMVRAAPPPVPPMNVPPPPQSPMWGPGPALGPPMHTLPASQAASPYFIQPSAPAREADGGGSAGRIVGLILAAAVVGLLAVAMAYAGAHTRFLIIALIGVILILGGGTYNLVLAFRESPACGLCYLFVPFYALYYLLSRWEHTWKGVGLSFAGFTVIGLTAYGMQAAGLTADKAKQGAARPGLGQYAGSSTGGLPSGTPPYISSGGSAQTRRPYESPQPPPPPADPVAEQVKSALASAQSAASVDRNECSRERAMLELKQLKDSLRQQREQAEAAAAANNNGTGRVGLLWADVDREVRTLESRLSALPSEAPPPTVFSAAGSTSTIWSTTRNAPSPDEISFRKLRLRPPAEALFDLTSSETDEQRGLTWADIKEPSATLMVRQVRKGNPQQQQPWQIDRGFMNESAQKQRLLTLDSRELNITSGMIGTLRFWRASARQNGGQPAVRFIAPMGDDWLIAEIAASGPTSNAAVTFENVVRSIRPAGAKEAPADPFSPARIAPRLADKPDETLALLRRHGAAAEPAVLPMLRSPELKGAKAAATFIAEFGTAAAIPDLRKAADSNDVELATLARTTLRRLAPNEFGAMFEVILDLKATEAARRSEAIRKLIVLPPEPGHRQEVATLLENMILSESGDIDRVSAGVALANWYGDKTLVRLLPILAKEDADAQRRDAAIEAVSGTKTKGSAAAVIRWLLKEPDKTVAALIRIGPASEESVVKVYNARVFGREQEDLTVRANCVRILADVGATSQAMQVLKRASTDGRDVATQEIAKLGMEAVKARMAAATSRPATRGS